MQVFAASQPQAPPLASSKGFIFAGRLSGLLNYLPELVESHLEKERSFTGLEFPNVSIILPFVIWMDTNIQEDRQPCRASCY